MPPQLLDRLKSAGSSVSAMTLGQKVIAVIGVAVLVLGATAFGRWVSTPSLVPVYANLSGTDGQAIADILTQDGVPFEATNGGTGISIARESVDAEKMKIAAAGLPSDSSSGSAVLASSGITTSQFMEKANYQRAMEADLAKTIEQLDGVRTAVVHIAVPEETVFTDDKGKTTASVLVETTPGKTLTDSQIQSILNLTASSVPNLDPSQVTISDSTGRLLSAAGQGLTGSGSSDARTQQYESDKAATIQQVLDKVLGPGKAIASVSAELNFDTTNEVKEEFDYPKQLPPLSSSTSTEKYTGTNGQTGGALGTNGVLGVDGTTTTNGGAGGSGYDKEQSTVNNPINKTTTTSQLAPGTLKRQSIAVVVDEKAAKAMGMPQLQETIANAAGVLDTRGDSLSVTQATFDTSAADAAAKDLEAAKAEDAKAAQTKLITQGAIGLLALVFLLVVFIAWRRAAKRRPSREALDLGELERLYPAGPVVGPDGVAALGAPGAPQLTPSAPDPAALRRAEVGELVDQQPAEVADLLRGWLADTRKV